MYEKSFCFDEIEATGNKIRIMNKMKAKNVMALAVNFCDEKTLSRIQQLLLSLSPEDLNGLKSYLDQRNYLKRGCLNSKEAKFINQLSRIALYSVPEDETLRKYYDQYKKNLEAIDELKIMSAGTMDFETVQECLNQIDYYNEENIALLEKVDGYKAQKAEEN